ncbi:hypothetical protein ACJ5NV_18680 [Loktanella agnita]|uniref:hypothetical protein n=1 Tax=Loktanella agnita TaxID=287097 RepID=UPI003988D78C
MSGPPASDQMPVLPEALRNLSKNTLVIGDLARWKAQGRALEPLDGLQFIDASDLNDDLLNRNEPEIILSPLVAGHFDALDIAMKLDMLGFTGRYRVVADNLPDAALIRAEVCDLAPELDFDLLLMSDEAR